MRYLMCFWLFLIVLNLIRINITLDDIYEENSLRVTTVEHHYHYDTEHYGTIRLNDKIANLGGVE